MTISGGIVGWVGSTCGDGAGAWETAMAHNVYAAAAGCDQVRTVRRVSGRKIQDPGATGVVMVASGATGGRRA